MNGSAPERIVAPPGVEPTVPAGWTGPLVLTLDHLGHDGRGMAIAAGIELAALDEPGARLPLSVASELWRAAVEVTRDEALGLLVSREVRAATIHGLGRAVATSASVRDALEHLAEAARDAADGTRVDTSCDGSTFELVDSWTAPSTRPTFESTDAVVASIVRVARLVVGREFSPVEVWLERPSPTDAGPFHQFFRCPVHFGAPRVRLVFDLPLSERVSRIPNPELASAIDRVSAQYLTQLDASGSFAREVRGAIIELLGTIEPTERLVARRLGWSTRSLQRRLHEERTTFRELLADCRREVAMATLQMGTHTVSELGHQLGFSHVGAFSRAFKRWTGQTPSAYALDCRVPVPRLGEPSEMAG
ncbi:MAG TPA: AraC family transcriptional regulator [Acidimicrobiales bacterium]|nr:AraC family transcriptional regulator [Acidimicrobiales bacterium]